MATGCSVPAGGKVTASCSTAVVQTILQLTAETVRT